jgi:HAD superfamily hydrolase (TIGR01509 family)
MSIVVEEKPFHPEAVLLDMDGLMLDTERPVIAMWIQAAAALGWNISADVVCRTIGIDEKDSRRIYMEAYGPQFPHDDVWKECFRLAYESAEREGISLRPGLPVMLEHIAALGIPAAVATSTSRKMALWKLEKAGLGGCFPIMVCGDDVSRGKPAPDIFLSAAEKLGKKPALCAGFEDSPAGLMALHAAGIPSVFIKDVLDPPREVLALVWRQYRDMAEAAEGIFPKRRRQT